MSILDEIQTGIRPHAEGADSSMVGIGHRWGVVRPAGERTVQVAFTPEIKGK